ncbi:MAG TPA: phosphatase PAP2 family protein [Microlunatus sp.]|nr:phosphatase PAP2 family protein [Microlunatus sp.]
MRDHLRWADGRSLIVRVLGPAVVVWGLVTGLGYLIVGPLAGPLTTEDALNQQLASHRTPTWDAITAVWSYLGSTEMVAAGCLLISGLVLWRMRDWQLAAVPAIAVILQLGIYLGVTALIRRERPSVIKLETLLPMSSFPSGHVGASVALYLSLFMISRYAARAAVRRALTVVAVVVPAMVAVSRFYRGMHHLSDLVAGALIGVSCALLAYGWYLHRTGPGDPRSRAHQPPTNPRAPQTHTHHPAATRHVHARPSAQGHTRDPVERQPTRRPHR